MLNDKVKFKGHIIVETIDKDGNITDKYEEDNLIMDLARINMRELVAGTTTGVAINKIVLGTEGHDTSYIDPKDETDGFTSDRTMLFSEESAGFTYPIVFTPNNGGTGSCTITSEPDTGTTMDMVSAGLDLTYTLEVPADAGNGTGTTVYTEAAFYADAKIFSCKTFNGKIKDNTVILRITWKISF